MSEFNPGDTVAANWMDQTVIGIIDTDGRFYTTDQVAKGVSASAFSRSNLRPLVVIDPEDREQVKRFARLLWHASPGANWGVPGDEPYKKFFDDAATALREFAKPAEPMCPARLMVAGEHFACDKTAGHDGLLHASVKAEAVWGDAS